MELNREMFEAWLFSQPDGRQFDYFDTYHCMGCQFVKETTNIPDVGFGGRSWYILDSAGYFGPQKAIPHFLMDILWEAVLIKGHSTIFTAADAKAAYRKLWPDTEPVIEPAKTQPQVQHETKA